MTNSKPTNLPPNPEFPFCIGATFTAEPLDPVIAFWGRRLNIEPEVRFAPYNQIEQTLLDSHSVFAANTSGVNILAIRLEDFGKDLARIRSNIDHLLDILQAFHSAAPSIFCVCPASLAFNADPGRVGAAQDIAARMAARIAAIPGFQFLHHEEIGRLYPVDDYEAAGGGQLGHIPYTDAYYTALGTALVRRAHAITRAPYKVIALDCDNTLWSGICGEDGPAGITLHASHRELQQFMLRRRDAGMLLAIASKNNEVEVIETFERNPEMPLQLGHFAAWRINWESKAENLAALSNELGLGLDSFIFVDDNAKECAETESSVPEVLAVPLPAAAEEMRHFLDHVWAFDRPVVTEEDRKRSAYYAQNRQFGAEMRRTANLEQFMANLDLKVRIAPLTLDRLPRVAQLTHRTNQFNFTGVRRTEAELRNLMAGDSHDCFTVEASDRFGDYGLVGVMIVSAAGGVLAIDTFLLSCRALGRGVEHRMMAFLAETAAARGLGAVLAELKLTGKNAPAQQFLDSLGRSAGGVYSFLPGSIRNLKWKPVEHGTQPPETRRQIAPAPIQPPPDYTHIARALSTPAQILAQMRLQSRGAMASPATETEARLAEIWADLLKVPSLSASDNFFDLGGHSLAAVLLLVRIHEAFGVELTIDDVYSSGLALAGLARRIDMLRLGGFDSAEYARLAREIEALSDEEARRMLAESEPEAGCGSS